MPFPRARVVHVPCGRPRFAVARVIPAAAVRRRLRGGCFFYRLFWRFCGFSLFGIFVYFSFPPRYTTPSPPPFDLIDRTLASSFQFSTISHLPSRPFLHVSLTIRTILTSSITPCPDPPSPSFPASSTHQSFHFDLIYFGHFNNCLFRTFYFGRRFSVPPSALPLPCPGSPGIRPCIPRASLPRAGFRHRFPFVSTYPPHDTAL
ncbi:hypothetical protein C8R44DRAFT_814979, partial [Mycena epipterygia]